MWKKATIGGVLAAAVLGTAGMAMASADGTTPSGTTPTPAVTATAPAQPGTGPGAAAKNHPGGKDHAGGKGAAVTRLKNLQHAEWVTKDKTGAFVTHEAIKGTVTAVSATSITVKAEDGVSLTYAVTSDTKVRLRTAGKGAAAKVTDLKVGEMALVTGTGKDSPTALHIVGVTH